MICLLEDERHHDHDPSSGGCNLPTTIMIGCLEDVTYTCDDHDDDFWRMSLTHVMIMMMTSGGCHLHMSSRDFSALKPSSLSANAEEAKQLATSPARLDSGES